MRPALVLACALLACATQRSRPPSSGPDAPPALQLPDGVRPLRYALDLEVVPDAPGFRGAAAIEIELAEPRTFVWMHARELRVSRASVEVAGSDPIPATFAQVNADGVAKVSFGRPVGPGRATLRFAWDAAWNEPLSGLYVARTGGDAYAATQLEPSDARRVFPSFDEPRFKTPFDVTLTVPAAAVAVSNGPVAAEEPAAGGRRRVRFAATEPLPAYLVFVGVGPFDVVTPAPLPRNAVRDRPLPVRALAPKGHGPELAFALDATAAIVPWFETYFGIPFPYAKLDQIALPDLGGAMENAGAIAYSDRLLLAPAGTPEAARRRIATVMAHEISHQWFGDLVTLPWWTDTWLNESFATWMGVRAAGRWRPDWNLEVEAVRSGDAVMLNDSLASSRAIRQPLRSIAEVHGQFDGMSYQKGGAVLAGFERLVGEERFREGVRAYLRAHLHGTGSADSLYAALSRAGGRDLAPALASFTDRPGVPLVSALVVCDAAGARLALSQSRWLPRGSDAPPGETWHVPVCARWQAGDRTADACTLVDGREGALALGTACPDWVMPEADGAGYARWTMPPPDLARLRTAGLARLGAAEKVSLARNLRGAQQAGTVPWGDAMATTSALASDPDPDVAAEPIEVLELARDRLVPAGAREAVAAFARARYRPVLDRLGWDGRPGESAATKRLRADVIDLLVFTAHDPEVRREAARRGAASVGLDGAPPRFDAIDPDAAEAALAAAVAERGAPAFEALLSRLGSTQDAALRPRILGALVRPDDPASAARAATLWRRAELRASERMGAARMLSRHAAGRDALLAEIERDPDAAIAATPAHARAFFPFLAAGACEASSAERLRGVVEPRLAAHPEMRRSLAQELERIRICAAERDASGAAAGAYFTAAAAAR